MIVVAGSLNYDLTIEVERFPAPGEAVRGHGFRTACGGKGANQAYAAGRMRAPGGPAVAMIGCVGGDAFGDAMTRNLAGAGVDVSAVRRLDGAPSGTAMILVDASGQNEIVIDAGANGAFTPEHARANAGLFGRARAVIAQLEIPLATTEIALALGRASGALTVLNPAPHLPLPDAVLAACDFVIPNENEAAALAGVPVEDVDGARRAAEVLRGRGAGAALVTLGAAGVWIDADGFVGHVPGVPVRVVDTVGAGDTFIGAFVTRMCEGARVQDAARFACAAAAIAVTRPGAQPSVPSRDEVERMLDGARAA